MDIDLQQLKAAWQQTQVRPELLSEDAERMARKAAAGRAQTASQKLAKYFRKSFYISCTLPLLAPSLVVILGLPLWVAIAYGTFGIAMAIVNYLHAQYLKSIDIASIPLVPALVIAQTIRRRTLRIQAYGMMAAFALIATMLVSALGISSTATLWGFGIGLIVGLFIATIKLQRSWKLIRTIQQELRSVISVEKNDSCDTK